MKTLIDRLLSEQYDEDYDEESPELADAKLGIDEIRDLSDAVNGVVSDAGASSFINAKVENYGIGFKVILTRNENGLMNLENGVDEKLVNELGWEKLDSEDGPDGSVILSYTP